MFADNTPFATVNYYRLKMIDNDGQFSYSSMVVLAGSAAANSVLEKIKPNPFKDALRIEIALQQQQAIKIEIVDLAGRVIMTKAMNGLKGNNRIDYTGLSVLKAAVYIVKIITEDTVLQQRVLKIN